MVRGLLKLEVVLRSLAASDGVSASGSLAFEPFFGVLSPVPLLSGIDASRDAIFATVGIIWPVAFFPA